MDPPPTDSAIRPAERGDIPQLARVQLTSALMGFAHIFPSSIPKPTQSGLESEWTAVLEDPAQSVLVAESDHGVVGVVAFGLHVLTESGSDSILRRLYVAPEHAGVGIGSLLHDRAIDDLRIAGCARVHLWVLERNILARRMYVERGWRLQRRTRSDWPGSGILELCYTLDLNPLS